MAVIRLSSRRAVQPQGFVGIDEGNPIARDCREALVTQGNHHVFVGTGAISPWVGSIQSPIVSPKYGVGGQNNANTIGNAPLRRPIATTSDATVMTVGRVSSAATLRSVTALAQSTNGSQLSITVGDGVTPGVVGGRAYLAGASGDFGGSFTLPAGSDYVAIVRQRYNVQQDLWVNGVQDPVTTSRTGTPVGYSYFGRQGSQANGIPLFMAAAWGRALTDAEMREISQNPWQLFAPIQRRVIVDLWTPPSITTQPTPQSGFVGGTATFSGASSGNPPPAYQWQTDTGLAQFYDDLAGTAGQNLTARGFTKLGLGDSRAALDGAGALRAQAGGNEAVVAVDTGSADQYVEVVLGANFASTTRARQCIQLRTQDRNSYYAAGYSSAEGLWELWDFNSRSGTYAAAAPAAGTVLRVEISSAGAVLKLNGATVLSNSAFTLRNTFTHAGLYMAAATDTDDVIRDVKIGALFAPLASDTFTGIGASLLGGRVMNNALGGSGTYAWASIADNFTGNGADAIITSSAIAPALVSVPGVTTARMRFDPNGGTSNVSLQILRNNGGPVTGVLFLLAASHTSLRVSSHTSDVRTDHATLGITAPGAPFWMEIEVVGLKVTCRILNDNLTTRNAVSHTFTGSFPVGGDFCGPAFFQDGSTGIFDSLILRTTPRYWVDAPSGTNSSVTTPTLVLEDDGTAYRLRASNIEGSVYSNEALLTVSVGVYRPNSDDLVTGWSSTAATLAEALNEAVRNDASYVTSPDVTGSPGPGRLNLTSSLPVGSYTVRVAADRLASVGEFRVVFTDAANTPVGATAWQIPTNAFATYELAVTVTGTATKAQLEVRA